MGYRKLNIYMAFDRQAGSEEGACLVFAKTVKDARKLAYPIIHDWLGTEYIDIAARRLRNKQFLYEEARYENKAHVIESPKTCNMCGFWGNSEIGEDGYCNDCREQYIA